MRTIIRLTAASILVATLGCGTTLKAWETSRTDVEEDDGLAVNQMHPYDVEIETTDNVAFVFSGSPTVRLIDTQNVQRLDIRRWPFSDGTLKVTLGNNQVPTTVAVTGAPGTENALAAAQSAFDTANKFTKGKTSTTTPSTPAKPSSK